MKIRSEKRIRTESETEDKTERNGKDQETEGYETWAHGRELQKLLQQPQKIFRNVSESGTSKTNRTL